MRERLPDERHGKTHHFTILSAKTPLDGAEGTTELEEHDGYLTTGCYPDGRLGEIFIRISKQGDERAGLVDGFATNFSIALQSGADLRTLCSKMIGTRFPPNGPTNNPNIPRCTSLFDYIGRWIKAAYLPKEEVEDNTAEVLQLMKEKTP
jgi:ribonucleoside-diphosphate reductase alpha chain